MDKHTLAGVVIAAVIVMCAALFYESDLRAWWERAQQLRRRRQRDREREKN